MKIDATITAAFLTGVLGPIALTYVQNKLKKSVKRPDPIKESLHFGDLINEKLLSLKEELECDRIWITQFHNGGHFYPTGKSIQKFSVIYEQTSPGVSSTTNNFQGIPINLFSKYYTQLLENNSVIIPDYKDETMPTYGMKYMAEELGTKSTYAFAMKSVDGKFIGVVGIDYVRRKKKLEDNTLYSIHLSIATLSGLLSQHLNSK